MIINHKISPTKPGLKMKITASPDIEQRGPPFPSPYREQLPEGQGTYIYIYSRWQIPGKVIIYMHTCRASPREEN